MSSKAVTQPGVVKVNVPNPHTSALSLSDSLVNVESSGGSSMQLLPSLFSPLPPQQVHQREQAQAHSSSQSLEEKVRKALLYIAPEAE